jgi:DNA polymerase elongation subunit (family B)
MTHLILDVETVAIDGVETYLEPVSAPSNYKDPDKIAAYIADQQKAQAAKAALDIDLARIVAIGYRAITPGQTPIQDTLILKDEVQECRAIGLLWETFFSGYSPDDWAVTVTFNGLGFDLPLLLRRSLYLGIRAPKLQLDRYKHPNVIDLLDILSLQGRLKYHGLQFYANRFGIGVPSDITGAEIAAAVAEGNWTAVEEHCTADVETTYALAKRMGVL